MALADYQLSFNGLTIGNGTDYDLTALEGLEGFESRTNDQTLPTFWGSQPGGAFPQARVIIVGVQSFPELTEEAAAVESSFLPASQVTPTALLPLTFKLPDQVEKRVTVRCDRRNRTRTTGETGQEMATWLLQLVAPDPRVYASEESITVAGAYIVDSSGLDYTASSGADLGFDMTASSGADLGFDYTGTVGGGGVSVTNDGDVDTYPSFTFETTASIATWTVINDTTDEQASFSFMLVPGHQVVVDMAGVATGSTVSPVTVDGAANYAIWQSPRVPIRLIPGLNLLRFVVTSGTTAGTTATIAFRSAWI